VYGRRRPALRRKDGGALSRRGWILTTALIAAATVAVAAAPAASARPDPAGRSRVARHILAIVREVKRERDLKAVIVRVDVGRREVVDTALGCSMTGVPATTRMHFRIGSMAIPYVPTLLLQLQQEGRLSLDDKLSKYLPALPEANRITLRMLANSTSGYYDYAQNNPAFAAASAANEFRQWTPAELLQIAFARGQACAPGTCFNYSHANFIVLGKVLRKVTGKPVAMLMRRRILGPLGLRQTSISSSAEIAPPVLHAFARRSDDGPYEDSSFWNPSWSIGRGEVMTSNIADMTRSAAAVGTGRLLSRKAHHEQVGPSTVGLPGMTPKLYYGLGLLVANSWVVQNPMLSGYVGVNAYLPGKRIAIAIESTYGERTPDGKHWSAEIFDRIGAYLAPGRAPNLPT
jgi:D-alanyl-D-alanine carboxypeptidase